MPVILSYALQYSNVNFSAISASTFDLFITEGDGDNSPFIAPPLSDAQVAALTAQGRSVVGYVNVAVTDANRAYWQDSWTSAGPHPRHEDDLNPVAGSAPAWLQTQPTNSFGIIVEFTHSDWKAIVIGQAVALVQRGYSGVFLDDVGAYYTLGAPGGEAGIRQMANAMCLFVAEIEAAIAAVNPNAYVVVNSDPYLHTNVTNDAAGAQAASAYLAAVDAHLLENQSATAIDYAQTSLSGETRLILESDGSPTYSYADSWARGILYTAPQAYNSLGTFAYPATAGADTLSGGDGPNQISGLGGNDALSGGGGSDTLNGGEGADLLDGGAGADTMVGGAGNDTFIVTPGDVASEAAGGGFDTIGAHDSYQIIGGSEIEVLATTNEAGTGAFTLIGNEFAQTIYGNAGANMLIGLGGNDVMVGGQGNDFYVVDSAGDVVIEAAGGGSDTVVTHVSYAMTPGQEIELLATTFEAGTAGLALYGTASAQSIYGNAGDNWLEGRGGGDVLVGLGGADTYAFTAALDGAAATILGFQAGVDKIGLDDSVFALTSDMLYFGGAFRIGSAAQDADDRIIYDQATGQLYFDADGNGAGAQVHFATLQGQPIIAASDFLVI